MSKDTPSVLFNKHGFGLHLPNLPKPDYLLLKERSQKWDMTFIQVILLALRALEHLPEEKWTELTQQVMKDA